jgi:hypothetical protein
MDERLNVIFFCSKTGQGAGSGSPADSPRRTLLKSVFKNYLILPRHTGCRP